MIRKPTNVSSLSGINSKSESGGKFGKRDLVTASLFLLFLLSLLLTQAACSYLTNFVVVNASGSAIEVRYKVKKPSQPMPPIQMIPVVPAILPASQLDHQIAWHDLSSSDFKFDPDN